jgi:energy-coupling factor transporter transmembrane protein EcfT
LALGEERRMRRRGPASSLDPSCRLICLGLLSSASLFASWPFAAIVALGSLSLLLLEGLSLATVLRESAFVISFVLLTILLRFFAMNTRAEPIVFAAESIRYGTKLLAAFLAGRLFYASTRLFELRDSTTRIARRIPIARRFDLGLVLSLILGYIPLIFDEWRDSLEAARSRGLPRRPSLSLQCRFLAGFLRRLILRAIALPQALVARGWSMDRGIADSEWRFRDSLVIALSLMAFAAALLSIV